MGLITDLIVADQAAKSAKSARRAERLKQSFIRQRAEVESRSLRKLAQREIGRQRAQFGAAGVSLGGTPGLLSDQTLLDTQEEIAFLQDTALLELVASRKRQKAASAQERLARLSTITSIVGFAATNTPALQGQSSGGTGLAGLF